MLELVDKSVSKTGALNWAAGSNPDIPTDLSKIKAKMKKIILNKDDYDNQQNHQIP